MLVSEVVICRREKRFKRTTVRLVVVTLAPLFLNCRSLIVEVRLVNGQRAHAVRFEEQTEIQLVCGQRLEIHRAVGRRVAVHPATVVCNNDEVFSLAHVFRALEHHVFEQMRETRPALTLIAGAYIVSDDDRVRGRGVILRQDHSQAILEFVLGEADGLSQGGRQNEQPNEQRGPNMLGCFHKVCHG